jgi:hypothetical protein
MIHEGHKGHDAMQFAFCPSLFVTLATFVARGLRE